MKRVAVVGAGWAGLACAVELAGAGVAVTLFEAARQAGGRARRVDWQGIAIDNGQHLMIGAYRETLRLLERIGSSGRLDHQPLCLRQPGFALRLPRLPAPFHLLFGLATARGLSRRDKLAAIRFARALRSGAVPAGQSVAELLATHAQPEVLIERLWAPICLAALNTPVAQASAEVFVNVLRDSLMGRRADSDFLHARGDLGRLFVDPALAYIEAHGGSIQLGHRVEQPARAAGAWHINGERYSDLVYAGHPAQLRATLPDLPTVAAVARLIDGYAWQPILTTWLRFAASLDFPAPLLGLGPDQAPWAADRGDLGPGLVSLVVSAEGPHLAQPEAERLAGYLALLENALGPLPPLLDHLDIVEKRATYACVPNLPRPANALGDGLHLAGDYTAGPYPATLEGAVRSGVQCARSILASAPA